MKGVLITLCFLLFASFAFAGDTDNGDMKADSTKMEQSKEKMKDQKEEKAEQMEEKKMADIPFSKTKSGVEYYDEVEGTGKVCKIGSKFDCDYTLWFADEKGEKKTRFQSSHDTGKHFEWTLGDRLIEGWNEGMTGMKEGGVRILRIPPALGYGQGGRGIPPNTTLIFKLELYKVLN